mmetsp:Transcript_6005/g.14350  ORF Transcript_6005/g.14350 Transcript_6005/m.14350 type:complete len:524 (+) Transcript_6005:107-1678(+)
MGEAEYEWLSDYVAGVLKSPTWVVPIAQFVDDHCDLFDDLEENKIEYTDCHNKFKHLVGDLLTAHLLEVAVPPEVFEEFSQRGISKNQELHRVLVEQLLSVDDFVTFKAMMVKQNADIHREVITLGDVADGEPPTPTGNVVRDIIRETLENVESGWQLYDQQLFRAEANSFEDEEQLDAQRRCEEAELQHAIALSMQLEEERMRQASPTPGEAPQLVPVSAGFVSAPLQALQGLPACYVPLSLELKDPPPPPGAGFRSQPLCHVLPEADVASGASQSGNRRPPPIGVGPGFTSSPLTSIPPKLQVNRVMRMEQLGSVSPDRLAATLSSGQAVGGAIGLGWRERAERAILQPVDPASPLGQARRRGSAGEAAGMRPPLPAEVMQKARMAAAADCGGPTEDEKRARAEHLKRQRDRLLEKRRQEREKQLAQCETMGRGTHIAAAVDKALAASGDHRHVGRAVVTELTANNLPSGLAQAQAGSAEVMRQALTQQLRQTLAGAPAGDNNEAVLNNQIDRLQRLKRAD